MNAITEMITQQVAGGAVRMIAQRAGLSEDTTQKAVQLAIPLILSAMARNAAQPGGATDLHTAVTNDHDGSIFSNLMGYLENPQSGDGAGILGHVFGGQQDAVQSNLAQATGMDQNAAGSILQMVAPLVMGAVGQQTKQDGLDAGGLSSFLNGQQQQAQTAAPDIMGALSGMLDSNKDGSVTDDVGRLLGNFFK